MYVSIVFPTVFQYLSHSKYLISSWSSPSRASLVLYYFLSIRYCFYI